MCYKIEWYSNIHGFTVHCPKIFFVIEQDSLSGRYWNDRIFFRKQEARDWNLLSISDKIYRIFEI